MIDFQGLLTVLKNTEDNPNIYMNDWDCGTSQCMIGSFCVANQQDKLVLRRHYGKLIPYYDAMQYAEAVAVRFGITEMEASWLFTTNPLLYHNERQKGANALTKEEALSRLRKFIYYKLHKQEMIIETGKNKQQVNLGRDISGRSSAVLASMA